MKYLLFLAILIGCKSGSRKAIVSDADKDTLFKVPVKHDTVSIDVHDPYQTGKDTIRLNKAMDRILKFPEVEAINKQIDIASNGAHGVSFIVHDGFDGDTSYYHFQVGDNSHDDRYVNIYDFLLEKKTGQIKAYDHFSGSIMNLQEWRKNRN